MIKNISRIYQFSYQFGLDFIEFLVQLTHFFTQGGYYDATNGVFDYILKYEETSETWSQVGTMKEARREHAVSNIKIEDVMQYATNCTNL